MISLSPPHQNTKIGEIAIKCVMPNKDVHMCKGIVREGIVLFGDDTYPGVQAVEFPPEAKLFVTNEGLEYPLDELSDMICFAIADGGLDSCYWEGIDFYFEIIGKFERPYSVTNNLAESS